MDHGNRNGQCIAVVSGKGGTGKTSFTAGVGSALAMMGKRTLCIDCDVGLRNLDLTLGLADMALMDFSDVAQGRCDLASAVVEHPRIKNLYLLSAPARMRGTPLTADEMIVLLKQVRQQFDFCLLDAPAGLDYGFTLATCCADRCIVVTNSDATALRDDTVDIKTADLTRSAVVIGSEGKGISDALLGMSEKTLKIPMRERCESLNAAAAATIVLWEMCR